jgi:hypothetical protein
VQYKTLVVIRDDAKAAFVLGEGAEVNLLNPGAVIRLSLNTSIDSTVKLISFTERADAETAFDDIVGFLTNNSAWLLEIDLT